MASAATALANYEPTTITGGSDTNIMVWGTWNVVYCDSSVIQTCSISSATSIWANWNAAYAGSSSYVTVKYEPPSADELGRLEEEQRRHTEERKAAKARAKALLIEHLSREQVASLEKDRQFVVHTKNKERTYVIKQGCAGNIQLLNDKGRAIAKFCIHPSIACPDEDTMLAQKLMIETDEELFLKIANGTALAA